MDDFQEVTRTTQSWDVQAQKLLDAHTDILEAVGERPNLRADLIAALRLTADWYALLKPKEDAEPTAADRKRKLGQAKLVRDGEVLVGHLMHLRASLNAHTRLLITEDRVERDGIGYQEAWDSWERDDEALSRMLQDFICITVTGRKADLHVKAVVEIMAGFWKTATGSDITQEFTATNEPLSPAACFICDVLECCDKENVRHLRSSVETQMKKYVAALPEDVKRAARQARAAKTQKKRDDEKAEKKAERDAKKAGAPTPC